MFRLTKIIEYILRFAWDGSPLRSLTMLDFATAEQGWHKNSVRFPAYVLVRIRTEINPRTERSRAFRTRSQ